MDMLALVLRLRAREVDTSDTPEPGGEVAVDTLLPLTCTFDTSDTRSDNEVWPSTVGAAFNRAALFRFHDVDPADAEQLAERLDRRDLEADERRLCLECTHLSGPANARRCANWRVTGMQSSALPGELVDLLQRCVGFNDWIPGVPNTPAGVPAELNADGAQAKEVGHE